MKLRYTSPANNNIEVVLTFGETILDFTGPLTFVVPVAEGNREYDYIVKRLWKIDDFPPVSLVPRSVTPLQARKVLRLLGFLDELDALLEESTPEVRDTWEYATSIDRTHPLIEELANELGLSDEDVDNLFIHAATL